MAILHFQVVGVRILPASLTILLMRDTRLREEKIAQKFFGERNAVCRKNISAGEREASRFH